MGNRLHCIDHAFALLYMLFIVAYIGLVMGYMATQYSVWMRHGSHAHVGFSSPAALPDWAGGTRKANVSLTSVGAERMASDHCQFVDTYSTRS